MAIGTTALKNLMADYYGTQSAFGALFTSTGPPGGASQAATNEVTGGSPAYDRQGLTWGSAVAGVATASATFDVPASTTVTWAGTTTLGVPAAADVLDRADVVDQAFASQGTYAATFTFTMS